MIATVAGLLLAAAFPNIGLTGLAWIAPALMLAAAFRTRGWEAFRIGYVAGLVFWLASLYWLLLIPVTGFPILGWVALSAFVALYPAVWVWLLAGKVGKGSWLRRTFWSLAGAAVWVALEMIRARLLGGFPWNFIGVSQFRLTPLIQIASITGVYGVSFLVVWASLSLLSAASVIFRHPTVRQAWLGEIILPLIVILLVFNFSLVHIRHNVESKRSLRVTLVQPAIPQTMIWDPAENSNRFEQVIELSERALSNQTDLLVWPEAALPEFNEASFGAITNLIQTRHVWMIFGADDVEPKAKPTAEDQYDYYNAAFLFDPMGRCQAIYRKQNLVIFGEYIPLANWLPFVKYLTPITGSFAAGDRPVPFELDRWGERNREPLAETNNIQTGGSPGVSPHQVVKTAALICFEDVFPQLVRHYVDDDTDFLVNITNDGWFGESAEQWQQAAAAIFRAVENGLPLVRCCNNGLTCWVDATGQIRQTFTDSTGSVYGKGFVTWRIPLLMPGEHRTATFYNRHGDWFGWSCVALTVVLLGWRFIKRDRHKPEFSTYNA